MRVNDIPEITQLSIPEKILLVEDLWDSISSNECEIPVPQSHIIELNARLKQFKLYPGNLLSLEELQTRIDSKK